MTECKRQRRQKDKAGKNLGEELSQVKDELATLNESSMEENVIKKNLKNNMVDA